MRKAKKKIGRSDKLDFPQFGLTDIPVKTDTGAYTSSIHCIYKEEIERDGQMILKFKLFDTSFKDIHERVFETTHFACKKFKSSFGEEEKRYIIETIIIAHGEEITVEFSLSDRSKMKFPVLLGRKFLNKRFVVNSTATDLSYKKKKEQD